MGKKIEDYLHLYLGCLCFIYEDESLSVKGIDKLSGTVNRTQAVFTHYQVTVRLIKPILRPLVSMTETERLQLAAFETVWPADNILPEIKVSRLLCLHYSAKDAQITKWLLERCFDLFDLIPAGLAIDSTTLTPAP